MSRLLCGIAEERFQDLSCCLLFPIAHHSSSHEIWLKRPAKHRTYDAQTDPCESEQTWTNTFEFEVAGSKKHLSIVSVIMRIQLESASEMSAAIL